MARGLPLGPGDEVLFSSLNHVSGAVAWDELAASRGVTVRRFDLPPAEGRADGPGGDRGLPRRCRGLRTEVPRLLYKRPGAAMDRTARDYEDYSTRAWPSLVALGDALDFQATIGSDASP